MARTRGNYELDIIQTQHLSATDQGFYWNIIKECRGKNSLTDDELSQYEEAKNKLIEFNLRLVLKLAIRFQKRAYGFVGDLEEMVSAGSIAVIKAIDNYDFEKGFKPSTFIGSYIEYAFKDYIRSLVQSSQDFSIHECIDEEDEVDREETITLEVESVEEKAIKEDLRTILLNELEKLNPHQREIIKRRYGFNGRCETLQEIGASKQMSRQAISTSEGRILAKMRKNIAIRNLNISL